MLSFTAPEIEPVVKVGLAGGQSDTDDVVHVAVSAAPVTIRRVVIVADASRMAARIGLLSTTL